MHILTTYIIEISVLSALISLFLDFCLREGKILGSILPYLAKHSISRAEYIKAKEIKDEFWLSEGYDSRRDYLIGISKSFLVRLLKCVVCLNIWVSAFIMIFLTFKEFIGFFANLPYIVIMPVAFISYTFTIVGKVIMYFVLSNFIVRFFKEKIL